MARVKRSAFERAQQELVAQRIRDIQEAVFPPYRAATDMAASLDIPYSTWANYYQRGNMIGGLALLRLLVYHHVSPQYVLLGVGPMFQPGRRVTPDTSSLARSS